MKKIIILAAFLMACEDTVKKVTPTDASQRSLNDSALNLQPDANVTILDWSPPDAYVDPCLNITSADDGFCTCEPQCCQVQMWYCPPNGLGVQAAEVTMNLCDDNLEVCDRSRDLTCPPNEILTRSDCNTILECPPGIENNIRITVQCEIEGVQGEPVSYTHLRAHET